MVVLEARHARGKQALQAFTDPISRAGDSSTKQTTSKYYRELGYESAISIRIDA